MNVSVRANEMLIKTFSRLLNSGLSMRTACPACFTPGFVGAKIAILFLAYAAFAWSW